MKAFLLGSSAYIFVPFIIVEGGGISEQLWLNTRIEYFPVFRFRIRIQSGLWIRIQEGKNGPQK